MLVIKAKLVFVLLALGLVAGGAGLAGYSGFGGNHANAPQQKEPLVATDLYGDVLPDGTVGRLGTARLRNAGIVFAIAWSPDGKVLASGTLFGFGVYLWDAATGRALHRIKDPLYCSSLAFSPDGKTLFTGDRFIDVVTGKDLRRLEGRNGHFASVAYSPDGLTVAACTLARGMDEIVLYETATGKERRTFEQKSGASANSLLAPPIAFSPDGKVLALGASDKAVGLWDVATGQHLRGFAGHDSQIRSVAFSPDGKTLASAGEDRVVKLWDAATGKLLQVLKDQEGGIATAVFSPDGKVLASGGMAGTVHLWDPATGQELRQWRAHGLSTNSLAFSPDGKVLASSSDLESAIRRWDIATGKEIDPVAAHTGTIKSVQFSGDGTTLFSCAQDRKMVEWDLTAGRLRKESSIEPLGLGEAIWYPQLMVLSPSGKTLAMVGAKQNPVIPFDTAIDNAICLWDNALGKEIRALRGHTAYVQSVSFSPDEKLLASAAQDGIRLWDVGTGKELHRLQEFVRDKSTLVFSPDSALLAYVGADNTIRLWDIAAAKELRRWDGGLLNTRTLAFSPDGRLIASGGTKGLCVWTASTGKRLLMQELENLPAGSLVFSPSGRVLAASGYNGQLLKTKGYFCTIKLLDVPTAQEIRHFEVVQVVHASPMAFAPDGRTLAFGCADSTILLWDATGLAKGGKLKPAPVRPEDLAQLWSDLAGDAPKADHALWTLALAPAQSLPFLATHLQPLATASAEQVAKLLAELESESYATRQKAAKALDDLGEAAERALRKTLENRDTALDVRQRVERILQNRDKDALRKVRAIEAVEQIASPEARALLQMLAKDAPNPQVAESARGALARIGKRTPR